MVRKAHLRKKYGITVEQWDEMFLAQEGKCLICEVHQNDLPTDLCVDHDHITKAIRGLLCKPCNWGLGGFRDQPKFLISAANYLLKHDKKQG